MAAPKHQLAGGGGGGGRGGSGERGRGPYSQRLPVTWWEGVWWQHHPPLTPRREGGEETRRCGPYGQRLPSPSGKVFGGSFTHPSTREGGAGRGKGGAAPTASASRHPVRNFWWIS